MKKNVVLLVVMMIVLLFSCGNLTNDAEENILNDTIVAEEDIGFTIPFELISGRIVVNTMLNGKVLAKFTIDNGVNELHLTETFSERYRDSLGIVLHPNVAAMGAFLSAPGEKSYVANGKFSYCFGDSVFVNYNKSSYVLDGEYTDDFAYILTGDEVIKSLPDGVIGIMPLRSFSKNGIIKINFDKKRLEFPEIIDSLAIPYKFDDRSSVMDFPVEFFGESGDKNYVLSAILDLGYYDNILMFGNKKVTRIIENIPLNQYLDVDIDDNFNGKIQYFRKIKLGKDSVIFNDIGTLYLKNINGPSDALIGIGVMCNYDMFFDYKNSYVYMKPLDKICSMIKDDCYITSGIGIKSVNVNDKLKYVVMITINERKIVDAELYDTILKIDNISLSNINRDSIYKISNDKSIPNKSITVKRGDKVLVLNRNK